jgi:hypothetical protein
MTAAFRRRVQVGTILALVACAAGSGEARAGWTPVLDVSGSSLRSAFEVRVAPVPKGSVAVWARSVGGETRIQARLVGRKGSLGAVRTLSAPGVDACFPKVAVAPDGSAMVGWWVDGATPVVQGRRIRADGSLGPILQVSGPNADGFDLALGPEGAATFVWVRAEAMFSVKARRIEPDDSLGAVHDLAGDRLDAWSPAVAIASDGVATAVWQRLDDDGQGNLVESRRLDPAGALGAVRRLGTGLLSIDAPRVAVAPDGAVTVVWKTLAEALRTRRIAGDGSLGKIRSLSGGTPALLGPNLAVAPSGAATVVWGRAVTGGRFFVEARRIGRTGNLGPLRVLARNGGDTAWPDVAVGARGAAVVVWPLGVNTVVVRRVGADGSLGGTRRFTARGRVDEPQVALRSDGTTAVMWTSQRPAPSYGARYVIEGSVQQAATGRRHVG